MLSRDGKKVLCDVLGCGKEAIGGCELRTLASQDDNHVTIPENLVSWCELDEGSLRRDIKGDFASLTPAELKVRYLKLPN